MKESEVAQCPTLCDPMDCSLPGSSVHGILQARVLERVAIDHVLIISKTSDEYIRFITLLSLLLFMFEIF